MQGIASALYELLELDEEVANVTATPSVLAATQCRVAGPLRAAEATGESPAVEHQQ